MKETAKKINKMILIRRIFLVVLDVVLLNVASFIAIVARFNSIDAIPVHFVKVMLDFFPLQTMLTILIFYFFRLYHSLWRYASIEEMLNVVFACFVSNVANFFLLMLMGKSLPRSYWIIYFVIIICFIGGSRFSYRVLRDTKNKYNRDLNKRIMIIGGGEAGNIIIKEIQNSKHLEGKIVCIIDDDQNKQGRYMQGVRVVGNRKNIV